jgi:hypothetical protein
MEGGYEVRTWKLSFLPPFSPPVLCLYLVHVSQLNFHSVYLLVSPFLLSLLPALTDKPGKSRDYYHRCVGSIVGVYLSFCLYLSTSPSLALYIFTLPYILPPSLFLSLLSYPPPLVFSYPSLFLPFPSFLNSLPLSPLSSLPSSLTPLFPPFLSYPSLTPSSSCYALSGLAIAQSSNISTVPPHTGTRMGSGHSSESSSTLPQVRCVLCVVCCVCHMALCCVLRPSSLLFSLDLLLTFVLFCPLFSPPSPALVSHTQLSFSTSPASPPLPSSHMILTLNHSPSLTSAARKIYSVLSYLTPCNIP